MSDCTFSIFIYRISGTQQLFYQALVHILSITEVPTCSLVVLPLATSTMWKPVRPATGMKNRPATHITASLRVQGSRNILREQKRSHSKIDGGPWSIECAVAHLPMSAQSRFGILLQPNTIIAIHNYTTSNFVHISFLIQTQWNIPLKTSKETKNKHVQTD